MTPHQLEEANGRYTCTVCGQSWKNEPSGQCLGVMVYAWGKWPEHLLTKKQLGDAGLQTGTKLPAPAGAVYRAKSPGGIMWLYDKAQGVPKKVITEAQRAQLAAAAEKSRQGWHCPDCGQPHYSGGRYAHALYYWPPQACRYCVDKQDAIEWARQMLSEPFLILDTETTGLSSGYNEIIQVAVASSSGEALLNTYVRARYPERMFETGDKGVCAHDIHGISPQQLENAPTWPEVYAKLRRLLNGQIVAVYNADFDTAFLRAHSAAYCLPRLKARRWVDVIRPYAAWQGNWSRYWGNYSYPALNGGHDALGDCLAVLGVIRKMAGVEIEKENHEHQL